MAPGDKVRMAPGDKVQMAPGDKVRAPSVAKGLRAQIGAVAI